MAAADSAKTVLVPIAHGTEEMEAVIIIDVLRRAGADVTVASVGPDLTVECSRRVKLVADKLLKECTSGSYDLIALPGGMPGAANLGKSPELAELLKRQADDDRLYAAICAAPAVVLQEQGLLDGRRATAHPAFVDKLADKSAAEQRVVIDGRLITSRGPGTAFEFALALVRQLYGDAKAAEVAGPMVLPPA